MFYVYTLTDSRDGRVFYVGKGCRDRIDHHEKEARRGVRSRKCDRIRQIEAAGLAVAKARVAEFAAEQDAYDFETERIAEIGLENLTNVMPGGQRAWLDRQAAAVARQPIRDARVLKSTRDYFRKWLAMVDSWPNGGTFPGLKNGDALAAELIAYARARVAEPA